MTAVIWTIFEILINYYQGFITALFIYKFLTPKIKSKANIGLIIVAIAEGTIITAFNYYTIFEGIGSILYWLCFYIYAFLLFKDNVIKKIFIVTMPLLLLILITSIELNLVAAIKNVTMESLVVTQDTTRFWALMLIQVTIPVVFFIIFKIYKFTNDRFTFSDWFPIILILTISFILVALLHTISLELVGKQHNYINIAYFLIFIINLIVFMIIYSLISKNQKLNELELLKIQKIYQQQYVDNANLQYNSIKKIRHDIKNQLSTVYTLISDGEYDEAMQLIEKSNKNLTKTNNYVKTNNSIANAIINSKLTVASAMDIQTSCVVIDDFAGIDPIDLCSILSNALDNAITACSDLPSDLDKRISLVIKNENGFYNFTVKNSIYTSVLLSNPSLQTSKHNKSEHGYGIKILHEIADKYKGSCNFFEDDDQFCCCIKLKII